MGMMVARAEALTALIIKATGHPVGGRPMTEVFGQNMPVNEPIENLAT